MFEKERIQEAYEDSILNESSEMQIKKAIEQVFPVKVKVIDVKRKIIFKLSDFVDDGDFDNFSKIDAIQDFIKKKFRDSIVQFKGRTIEIEEL
jgi:hypothetical protein